MQSRMKQVCWDPTAVHFSAAELLLLVESFPGAQPSGLSQPPPPTVKVWDVTQRPARFNQLHTHIHYIFYSLLICALCHSIIYSWKKVQLGNGINWYE